MPPNNANSRKSTEVVHIRLELEDHRPASKCISKEETSTRCEKIQANGIGHSKSQTNVKTEEKRGAETSGPQRNRSVCSLVDELLCDIYSKMEVKRRTSATTCDLSWHESDCSRHLRNEIRGSLYWQSKDMTSLKVEKARLEKLITEEGTNLVKHLKRKNFLLLKRETHYDVITAYIQAFSTKRREDTKIKFSLTPGAETGFSQWLDAMKMVAQLPGGMPSEFRTKLWLQLSEKHLNDQNVEWEKAEAVIFNEFTNPDDEELGVQIVKDLHRTGCSLFCGEQEHNQALLKRVLLAYARWNKNVGYCQGFNMLAALILQVMDKDERNAVKVMIYLIEGVLPESYFANNLRGLSVDMAVFRDLLRLRLPKLSKHLEALQHDTNAGASYEPPLTNVFTMQWFLTLFSNCLPQQTVLRVWDLVFLYGNEVLLRTALAIWGVLQDRVITVESADEFYSVMGVVTREMLEFGLMDANALVKMIAMVDPFPNELQELREKYLYNISPWTQSVQSAARKGIRLFYSDPDDQDDTEDEEKIALATAYGVFRRRESTSKELQVSGPTLDISVLKQQYAKLRQRQRQAHVIITAACSSNLAENFTARPSVSVNHLLMGKSALVNKGRRIGPPEGSIPPPNHKKAGDDKEEKEPKIVISGETFHWKSSEERKPGKTDARNESNKQDIQESDKNRPKAEEEACRTKTNHDRMIGVSEKSVEDSPWLKESGGGSSGSESSTSTELCDDEFYRYTDFESDEASRSDAYEHPTKSPDPSAPAKLFPGNGGCDEDNLTEIKSVAIRLVSEIEERVRGSGKVGEETKIEVEGGERKGGEEVSPAADRPFDNKSDSILESDIEFPRDNILKSEPEVPRCENVIRVGSRLWEEEGVGVVVGKARRKSDLGSSVIRENLAMLSKFSQKNSERVESRSLAVEKSPEKEEMAAEGRRARDEEVRREFDLVCCSETECQKRLNCRAEEPFEARKNLLVERAISPMAEKSPKAVKVNKEVNTELTFGVDEVEISTRQSRKKDLSLPTTARRSREPTFREKDEIKQRIETSKSDWELKMRKIAELETTTRETLNEIQAKSIHRKSLHRSLDRNIWRSYLEEEWGEMESPEKALVPRIRFDESSSAEGGESSHRKLKISALSFDEITSRTEKLLGNAEAKPSAVKETGHRQSFSPEPDVRNSKDSTAKFKRLIEESFGEEVETRTSSKSYEFFSSPTSPEYRTRSNVRYPDFLTPKKYPQLFTGRYEDDSIRITQEESKTGVEMLTRKESPERRKPEVSLMDCNGSKGSFNPFPTRSASRPKELGVKLGLYPTSPETQSKKS